MLNSRLKLFFHPALSLLFPSSCSVCGKDDTVVCQRCAKNLRPASRVCFCGEPTALGEFCAEHTGKFLGIVSQFEYSGEIKKIVINAKFNKTDSTFILLRKLFLPFAKRVANQFSFDTQSIVVSSPPSLKSDHSKLMSTASRLGHYTDLFKCNQEAKDQKDISFIERFSNAEQKFSFKKSKVAFIKNKSVIIIDDVCTTGATITTLASKCLQFGANSVLGITLLRSPFWGSSLF